ncbi:MAG: peptidylprolyl isomerase [Bacteroidaceae bacterium]|nr:peptidylprolyl isomerase [Bacteroidaceae bacterium]
MPQVGEWLNANQPNFVLSLVLSISVALVVIAFCLLVSQLLRVSPFLQLYLFGKKASTKLPLILLVTFLSFGTLSASAKKKEKRHIVRIETSMGNIRVALSDDTPLHRDNFLKLAREGFYNGTLFHRCIKNFMIQGGDPDSRGAEPGKLLGDGGTNYTIPAEFDLPYLYHWRGALAAAREPDDVNPEMESSGCQFYIVYGKKQAAADIRKVREMLEEKGIELTPQMIDDYIMRGGTPYLDGQYTVFGEVIEGMEVVKRIQQVKTDENDRPLEDVVIRRMVVEQ